MAEKNIDIRKLLKSDVKIDFKHYTAKQADFPDEFYSDLHTILMMIGGDGYISSPEAKRKTIKEDCLCMVPQYTKFKLELAERAEVFFLEFDYLGCRCDKKLCKYEIENGEQIKAETLPVIPMNYALKSYANLLKAYVSHFDEILFAEMKYKEFFFLLCESMTIGEFANFLHPSRTNYDTVFRRKVLDNAEHHFNVPDLAKACGYSQSSFRIKFAEEFHDSPGNWMKRIMMKKIAQKLADPNLPFSEIAFMLNMSSVNHFSRFCKTNFGKTPTQLRCDIIHQQIKDEQPLIDPGILDTIFCPNEDAETSD